MKTATKKQLLKGIYFTCKISNSTRVYQLKGIDGSYYVKSYVLFSDKVNAIDSNHLSVSSVTDKYLTCWDIHFGKKQVYKVKMSDLTISETQDFKLI